VRLVPDLDARIALLQRRQRDRRAYIAEQEALYARKEREIENLKGLRNATKRGEEGMGVIMGPMEIFCHCDWPGCGAGVLIWSGDPEAGQGIEDPIPAGWSLLDGKTYCPKHS
jgi:hypothetical protein